jgi:hypothetical protein
MPWSGSLNPQIAGFKRQLQQALNKLKEIGLMLDENIEKGMVVVIRNNAQIASS